MAECPDSEPQRILLRELEKRLEMRFMLEHEARDKLEGLLDKRLDEMNQFRAQIDKERTEYMTRQLYEDRHASLIERMNRMETWQSKLVGVGMGLMVLSGILGAVIVRVFIG